MDLNNIFSPSLKKGEEYVYDMKDENDNPIFCKWGIPFSPVTIYGFVRYGVVQNCYKYTTDFQDFVMELAKIGVSFLTIEEYFLSIFKMRPDIFDGVFLHPNCKERYAEIKLLRNQKTKEIVETYSDYDKINLDNKNTIDLAKNLHRSRLGVLCKTDKEYKESRDSNINLTGNLAQVILPAKSED